MGYLGSKFHILAGFSPHIFLVVNSSLILLFSESILVKHTHKTLHFEDLIHSALVYGMFVVCSIWCSIYYIYTAPCAVEKNRYFAVRYNIL